MVVQIFVQPEGSNNSFWCSCEQKNIQLNDHVHIKGVAGVVQRRYVDVMKNVLYIELFVPHVKDSKLEELGWEKKPWCGNPLRKD